MLTLEFRFLGTMGICSVTTEGFTTHLSVKNAGVCVWGWRQGDGGERKKLVKKTYEIF